MKPVNHIKIPKKKVGVLLVNLGTPEVRLRFDVKYLKILVIRVLNCQDYGF